MLSRTVAPLMTLSHRSSEVPGALAHATQAVRVKGRRRNGNAGKWGQNIRGCGESGPTPLSSHSLRFPVAKAWESSSLASALICRRGNATAATLRGQSLVCSSFKGFSWHSWVQAASWGWERKIAREAAVPRAEGGGCRGSPMPAPGPLSPGSAHSAPQVRVWTRRWARAPRLRPEEAKALCQQLSQRFRNHHTAFSLNILSHGSFTSELVRTSRFHVGDLLFCLKSLQRGSFSRAGNGWEKLVVSRYGKTQGY